MDLNRKKFFRFSFLIFLFIGLIVTWLGFGERGFLHLYRMEKDKQAYLERIRKIEKENQALVEEIHRLNTDSAYLESVARKELGLVKEDEILYKFSRGQKSPQFSATEQ